MDQMSPLSRGHGACAQRASLALVNTRFRLAQPAEATPQALQEGLGALVAWPGTGAGYVNPAPPAGVAGARKRARACFPDTKPAFARCVTICR